MSGATHERLRQQFPTGLEEDAPVFAFSKAGHVYAILRREILDGMHPPGT